MDICSYVNVFHGCSTVDLPTPKGAAVSWHFIKAVSGNTTPAAVLPFGKYSCCMYTKGYPTGYGDHRLNCSPNDLTFLPEGERYFGLSHFHQSGTGMIDYYYNYAPVTAFFGESPDENGYGISSEEGRPGYYGVTTENGIKNEATVSPNAAHHRFTFPEKGGRVAVDFTNNGLKKDKKEMFFRPLKGELRIVSEDTVYAAIDHNGLTQHFFYRLKGARLLGLTKNDALLEKEESVRFSHGEDCFGAVFEVDSLTAEGIFTSSFLSKEHALSLLTKESGDFDEVRQSAYAAWNEMLSRIEISGCDEREKEIFYSNLYHSLVKPSDRSGEDPFDGKPGFMVDFSTMWDIYKTQLPLVFTLCPEAGEKIIGTFTKLGIETGRLPHTLVLKGGFHEPSSQACMLAEHSVCDAYYRGIKADYHRVLKAVQNDMKREDYAHLYAGELPKRLTHLLDAAEAARAVAAISAELGEKPDEAVLALAERGTECYNEKTGLLWEDHDYYEGNVWNYSFRLMGDMEKRVALAGGKEKFAALLDRFFGFTFPESVQTRFEGFNNEPDMEVPYGYLFAGRSDRLCEVIDLMRRYMFTTGRGGLPGNNDSGGLSSCFVWNASGVFPVTGQDLMLIGSPFYEKTVFHLPGGKDFTVRREGKGIYTKKAVLNGRTLDFPGFTVREMMNGGTLTLSMSEQP